MNKKQTLFLSIHVIFLCFCAGVTAEIRLPGVIGNNMVLQQQSTVNLWGWSAPAEKIFITASWSTTVDSVVASGDAKWNIAVETPAAGGPYTITFKGRNTIVLNNVMIGEVWVCSGQSNMEWSNLNKVPQMLEELPNSANANLRLFHIPKTTAENPQEDCAADWAECNPGSLNGFSAVAYFFGKQLQQQLNVPVGLINTSWGGTAAEVWTPEEQVKNDPVLKTAAEKINKANWWPNLPGRAYNAMIAPITSFNIAGAIWYQGESNTGTAATYDRLMTTLINSWRDEWKKDFPFYYVQIAPFAYGNKNVGALLREAQTQTLRVPHTGMVVITDLVDNVKDIHPHNKRDVGSRLAAWALADTYHKENLPYKSPMYSNMTVDKDKVTVYFNNAPNGLVLSKGDKKATEFYIAGNDKVFFPADARIERDHVILSSKQVKEPVAVRFAFSNTAMANLFSKEGLPVNPFRTDDWEVDTE
ncbi:MAG: sialate O-acetylesterase [Chitinophagaceae bacterium]|nr:sialate O-acetylesterase [Chitinophagaceae bacterium]